MPADTLTLPLPSPLCTIGRAGGKGQSLARLAAGGFPVPEGFILTTDAYRAFVAENGGRSLTALPDPLDLDDLEALEAIAAKIHARFSAGRIPAAVAGAAVTAYERLGGEPRAVAVRSSATAED